MIPYEDITRGYYWADVPGFVEKQILKVSGVKPFYTAKCITDKAEVIDLIFNTNSISFLCKIPSLQEDHTIDAHGFISKLYPNE